MAFMNSNLTAALVAACLFAAVWIGMRIRRFLPEHHLSADTKDTVKLAMGLVATMSALLLGLLVSSAKSSYDATRGEIIQMAAKVAFLDRVLAAYGPDAATARDRYRATVQEMVGQLWPEKGSTARLAPDVPLGNAVYAAIQSLSPENDTQRAAKSQAASLAIELGQLRTLLCAQMVPSISKSLLVVVVAWLVVIFLGFSLVAPPNATAALSLLVAALSVSGAIFLILELDHPFGGLIQISSTPLVNALNQVGR
jgi:hypothetical protein